MYELLQSTGSSLVCYYYNVEQHLVIIKRVTM